MSTDLLAAKFDMLHTSHMLAAKGHMQEAEHILAQLEESLAELPHGDPGTGRLRGLVWGTSATYAALRGNVALALTQSQRALARLPADCLVARSYTETGFGLAHLLTGDVKVAEPLCRQAQADGIAAGVPSAAIGAICCLGEVLLAEGRLRDAAHLCDEAFALGAPVDGTAASQSPVLGAPVLRLAGEGILPVTGSMPATGLAGLVLGQVLYEWNDLSAAERCLTESLDLLRRGDLTDCLGLGRALLGRVKEALGDRAGASTALAQALDAAHASGYVRYVNLIDAYQARAWLANGDLAPAIGWAESYSQGAPPVYLRPFEDLTLARVLLAQGRPDEALAISDAVRLPALAAGRNGHAIDTLVVRALALAAEHSPSSQIRLSGSQPPASVPRAAYDALMQALSLAAPESYRRVFLDEGETLKPLLWDLAQAPEQQPISAHIDGLLPAFPSGGQLTQPVPIQQAVLEG